MLAWSETVASGPAVKDARTWPLSERAWTVHGRAGSAAEIGLCIVFGGTSATCVPLTVSVIATVVPLSTLISPEADDWGVGVGGGAAHAEMIKAAAITITRQHQGQGRPIKGGITTR